MNIKSRVDKIEKIIDEQKGITLDDRFSDWTKEELVNYVAYGTVPVEKTFGHVSDRAYNHSKGMFDGWTREDLTRYVLTGEKPKESRL